MQAWSGRHYRLVGVALLAALIAGAAWSSGSAQEIDEATVDAPATDDYTRGLRLFHSGRYDEALPYFIAAKDEAAAHFGPESSAYATALNNLAELYRVMERYDEAEPLFRRALEIEEARLGPNDPGLARPLNNLALLLRAEGRYDEAERDLKRSLAILQETLGNRHPDVAGSLNNLARLYETMGLTERALPLLERSLMIAEDTLGAAHPSTQQISSNLERVTIALAAGDDERTAASGPPAELMLPPPERPVTTAADTPSASSAEPDARAPLVLAPDVQALPEPAAGATTAVEPAPTEAPTDPAPEAPLADPGPAIDLESAATATAPATATEAPATAAAIPEMIDEAPQAAASAAAPSGEDDVSMVLPLPESRPSGRRWAKLSTDRFAIHLASVRSPISASEEWARLHGQLGLPDDIGQLEPARIEVAEEGVFYRVLGGPFASRTEAAAACQPIREKGEYCGVLGHGE